MKPSATSSSAARSSSAPSGSSVSSSPITSSLIHSGSSASRARRAVRTASRAVWQPAVLGSTCTPRSRSTSKSEPRAAGSTLRSATVTISEPLAATASDSSASEEKPPVPTSRRDWSVRPPSSSESSSAVSVSAMPTSSSLHRAQHLCVAAGLADEQREDELGRERGQQDPVAVVPGRPHQPAESARSERREVVWRAGTQPDAQLLDLELAYAGDDLVGLAQQLIDTAELGAQREAALFDGRAERVAPIGARHEVAALKAEHVTHEPGPRGIAEPEDLASDGPHGHRAALGQAADLAAPGAGREQHALGLDRK